MKITSRKQALQEMEKLFGPNPVAHRTKTPHPAQRFVVGFMSCLDMYSPNFDPEKAHWRFCPAGYGPSWDAAIEMASRHAQQARDMAKAEEVVPTVEAVKTE